jgi:predicted amidohydrolase
VHIRKPFKAAVIEFNPCLNNLDTNIFNLLQKVTEAAECGAKLIVTPEMATTGYHYENRQAIEPYVDTIPGKTTKAFESVAREYSTYIVIGMAEVDEEDGLFYNSAALIGPNGYIGKYRKIHQWAAEDSWASWGDMGVPVYKTEIGNIAMIICMDATYFESARMAAINGADILCFPTNSTGGTLSMLQAWAEMNGLYVLGANRSNTEIGYHMVGASTIWSPKGKKLAETPYLAEKNERAQATILYANVDPLEFRNSSKKRLTQRRPELYRDLLLYSGPWDIPNHEVEMGKKQCAALLQYIPQVGEKIANLNKIRSLVSAAVVKARDGGSLLSLAVCPELSLTGPVHSLNIEMIHRLGETDDGETMCEMKKLAQMYHTHLVFGMIEKDQHLFYNTIYAVAPNGDIVGKTRKMHLTAADERWAVPGKEIVTAELKGIGTAGLMVGYDAAYPEMAGVLAVKRVNFIIIPSCWYGEFGETMALHTKMMENKFPANTMTTWDAIARFSQAQTLIANFTGTSLGCMGGSALYTLDPIYGGESPIVASPDEEEALVVPLNNSPKDWWFDQQKLLLSRRIQFYKPLVKKYVKI